MKTHLSFVTILVAVGIIENVSATIMDGLAGYWQFDETNGIVAHEASGNGLDGFLTNYPAGQGTWVAGQIGGAGCMDVSEVLCLGRL